MRTIKELETQLDEIDDTLRGEELRLTAMHQDPEFSDFEEMTALENYISDLQKEKRSLEADLKFIIRQ